MPWWNRHYFLHFTNFVRAGWGKSLHCFEARHREHHSASQKQELLEARRKAENFQGQRRKTAAVPAWLVLCALLPEQKEKVYGLFSHFLQSITSVEAGWRLSFSDGAEASPHLSCRDQGIPICHRISCPEWPVPETGDRTAAHKAHISHED